MYPYRRRRSLWWWVVIAGVLVAGVALVVNSRGAEIRREAAFFDTARTLAQEVDQVATGFRRLVTQELPTVTRNDFEALMDRLATEMVDHAASLKQVEAPDSARAAREMLEVAIDSWATGLLEFRVAVTEVTDTSVGVMAVDRLGGAIVQLRVGDVMYERFLDRAEVLIQESDVSLEKAPSVVFVSQQPALLNAEGLARTIRDSTGMGVRRDIAILQVVFNPLPGVGSGESGEMIFPATDRLQFSAVIGNRGNVDQKGAEVSARISQADRILATFDGYQLDLAPGEIGSVLFAPLAVQQGAEYQLELELAVLEDEIDLDDNTWEYLIRINPSA